MITARELRSRFGPLPSRVADAMQPFAAWCAQTGTIPEQRGDLVAIPHTLDNRKAMDTFTDYKVSSIQDGVITLRPRRGNEVW